MSISYDDFKKLDLRVAKILKIEEIPGKSRIVKGEIDLGDETRDVIIGGAEFYEPDDLIGKTVIVVANLEPKKMAGVESNAMLLAADINDKPFWLTVDPQVPSWNKNKVILLYFEFKHLTRTSLIFFPQVNNEDC